MPVFLDCCWFESNPLPSIKGERSLRFRGLVTPGIEPGHEAPAGTTFLGETVMDDDRIKTVAKAIADDLFCNAFGEVATRLIMADDGETGMLDIGGWSHSAAIDRIVHVLSDVPGGAEPESENQNPSGFWCCGQWQMNYQRQGECLSCGKASDVTGLTRPPE